VLDLRNTPEGPTVSNRLKEVVAEVAAENEWTVRAVETGPRQSRWSCGQDQADGPRDVASVVSQGCGDVGVSRAA